jgi:hypothetical protein
VVHANSILVPAIGGISARKHFQKHFGNIEANELTADWPRLRLAAKP